MHCPQVPDLDAIVVPVGGGGMISGICIAAKAIKPDIKIYAAEPLSADNCARSFVAKERVPLTSKLKMYPHEQMFIMQWKMIKFNLCASG